MSAQRHPRIFLSYAQADQPYAERLRERLEREGCEVHDPTELSAGAEAGPMIEEAVRSADHVVLLFGKHRKRDSMQELEWQAALEAKWNDPAKNLIPVLIGQAEVPNFLRGVTSKGEVGFQLKGLREVGRAAEAIANGLKTELRRACKSRGVKFRDPSDSLSIHKGLSLDAPPVKFSFSIEQGSSEERRQRFEDIAEFAEQLES